MAEPVVRKSTLELWVDSHNSVNCGVCSCKTVELSAWVLGFCVFAAGARVVVGLCEAVCFCERLRLLLRIFGQYKAWERVQVLIFGQDQS